jgi:hypothetical protein
VDPSNLWNTRSSGSWWGQYLAVPGLLVQASLRVSWWNPPTDGTHGALVASGYSAWLFLACLCR